MTTRARVSVLALAVLLSAGRLFAQDGSELRGRVVEAGSGEAIEGALLSVDGPATASAVSGPDGAWRMDGLPAGEYRLRAERIGFAAHSLVVDVPAGEAPLTVALEAAALPLDAVVVTASRRLQRLAEAPVSTELITRRDIDRAGTSDLASVLVERTGIQLEGGHPAGEGVMLQGLGTERVLVLLDGQAVVGRIAGQVDLSRIATSSVERVEVVKGPQSSLYGSAAMGGVVNVITRTAAPERWSLELDATAGSQGRADGVGTLRGTLGEVSYVLSGGRRATDLVPGQAEAGGALARRWDGFAKLGWAPGTSLTVDGSFLFVDERQRWQGGQLFQFADNRQANVQLGATWESGSHRLRPAAYWTEFEHLARAATAPEPVAGTGEREAQRLLEGELLYNTALGSHAIDAGIEARREETTSDRVRGRDRTLHTLEPFGQVTLKFAESLSLVPGARLSWSEQWGTHFTPRVTALYRPVAPLALRASVGQGFRAPAFKELYMQFLNVGPGYAYTVRGNEGLRPEESRNVTVAVEWARGSSFVRGQAFHNRFKDFIETRLAGDSTGVTVYTYGNVADGFTRGLELEGGVTRGGLRIEGGYAWLEARDSRTDEPLLGRPTHSARLTFEHALPTGLRGAVTTVYTGAAPVQFTDGGVLERDGFLRVDLRLAQTLPRGLELSLGARNALDAQPDLWPGFGGRHLYLGLGWRAAAGGPGPTPQP